MLSTLKLWRSFHFACLLASVTCKKTEHTESGVCYSAICWVDSALGKALDLPELSFLIYRMWVVITSLAELRNFQDIIFVKSLRQHLAHSSHSVSGSYCFQKALLINIPTHPIF